MSGNCMARVFITGSTDGLGRMAAELLIDQGHQVVLHARNSMRARDLVARLPRAKDIVIGDLSSITQTREVAEQVNRLGRFDAVIHNAAVGYREPKRIETQDGLPQVFAVNTIAPYLLTALIERPKRLVYLSSLLHRGASASLEDLTWTGRPWHGTDAYAETKLHDVLLAFAVARLWSNVLSNALEPGWVSTKMGGSAAPDDMNQAHRTQAWLAVSDDDEARVTGQYFFHLKQRAPDPTTRDAARQDALVAACQRLTGVALPAT
jgi:NAD(P)-dependent dehydrogenase (short-subunit alcohol dehydrogenase family)